MNETFTFLGRNRIYIGAQAALIESEREIASEWAANHITINPAHAWVLGKFVEAEQANNNNQYFALDDLEIGKPTIDHAPMNINHSGRNIVGAFVASELVFPTSELAAGTPENPYIESLGVFWKYYFADEYKLVQKANAEGSLFYSMECVPQYVSTVGGKDDTAQYAYEGRTSPNYPDELNTREVPMKLINPHFVGGALILPPVKPGWTGANSNVVANYIQDCWKEAEMAYEGFETTAPSLDARVWEAAMAELILLDYETECARTFSTKQRKDYADSGVAMGDGSFPIPDGDALKRAIRLAGNAKSPDAARAHIRKRAAALGLGKLVPEGWGGSG